MREIRYIIKEIGGMHSEWENALATVTSLEQVIEILRTEIGGDEMDGENWVDSIKSESDWFDFDGENIWGNECYEVAKV